jgi:hypothetical protein
MLSKAFLSWFRNWKVLHLKQWVRLAKFGWLVIFISIGVVIKIKVYSNALGRSFFSSYRLWFWMARWMTWLTSNFLRNNRRNIINLFRRIHHFRFHTFCDGLIWSDVWSRCFRLWRFVEVFSEPGTIMKPYSSLMAIQGSFGAGIVFVLIFGVLLFRFHGWIIIMSMWLIYKSWILINSDIITCNPEKALPILIIYKFMVANWFVWLYWNYWMYVVTNFNRE